jgi:hypothetical protein
MLPGSRRGHPPLQSVFPALAGPAADDLLLHGQAKQSAGADPTLQVKGRIRKRRGL